MRKELETIALIENYLSGKLSPEERLQFEAEMAVNDELREETELQRDLVGAILLAAFADDMKQVHTDLVAKPSKTLGKLVWYSLSGFLLIVGLTSAMVWWHNYEKMSELPKTTIQHTRKTISGDHLTTTASQQETTVATPPEKKKIAPSAPKSRRTATEQTAVPFDPDRHRVTVNLEDFQPSFRYVTMNPNEDFTFKMAPSQSTVFIPAHSIRRASGETVTGPVEIRYREYRDAADIAFSKIPMTVHEYGEELPFNSAGMFEIFAYQNGEKLSLDPQKPMIVDYKLTQNLDSLYFWQLKDNKWDRLRSIDCRTGTAQIAGPGGPYTEFPIKVPERGKLKLYVKNIPPEQQKNLEVLYKAGLFWEPVSYLEKADSGYIFQSLPNRCKVRIEGMKPLKFSARKEWDQTIAVNMWLKPKHTKGTKETGRKGRYETSVVYNQADSSTAAKSYATSDVSEAGKKYADMVSGLKCPEFGVYNCDQTYRIAQQVQVRGQFKDENGQLIESPGMLSVIATGVNGAISYWPQQFVCSRAGTTLLLFTNDRQIYALNKEEFDALNIGSDGAYTLQVRNMTAELRNSDDLRKYLGLTK